MVWVQGGIAFCLWIAYGAIQSRRSGAIRLQVGRLSRVRRAVTGGALFVASAMVLLGGLAVAMERGAFTENGMTPLGFLAVTVLGLVFVHSQTMGTAMLVSLLQPEVTNQPDAASLNRARPDLIQGDQTQS